MSGSNCRSAVSSFFSSNSLWLAYFTLGSSLFDPCPVMTVDVDDFLSSFFSLCSPLSALLQGSTLTICLILLATPNHVVQRSQLFALYFASYFTPSRDRRLSTRLCPYLELGAKTLEDCYTEHSLAVLKYHFPLVESTLPTMGLTNLGVFFVLSARMEYFGMRAWPTLCSRDHTWCSHAWKWLL
jgi:hypothetical protein